ncbi:unnamed protein product, partial [marine sediment metagenome]
MKRQEYTAKLLHLYKDTFRKEGQPSERYYQTKPTIPWVGDHYGEHRILIYASAENLGDWVDETKNKSAFFTEHAFNRHNFFWSGKGEIGIEPFDRGGLRLVGIMCLRKLGFEVPKDITSCVAVANLSKFSLKRNGSNADVKTKRDMKPSCNYLQIDLKVLKPNLIINASGMGGVWLKKIFEEFTPVINLYQYTKTQRAFHNLRSKIEDLQVQEFRPVLTKLIKEYGDQLKEIENKISKDDFIRYFCLVQSKLHAFGSLLGRRLVR